MDTGALALEPLGAALIVAAGVLVIAAVVALVRGLRRARAARSPLPREASGLVLLLAILAVIAAAYGWALLTDFSTAVGVAL